MAAVLSLPSHADIHEFQVLYTNNLTQKRKDWHDGYLKWHTFNFRSILYDSQRKQIGSEFFPNKHISSGDSLEFSSALVEVGDQLESLQANLQHVYRGGAVVGAEPVVPASIARNPQGNTVTSTATPRSAQKRIYPQTAVSIASVRPRVVHLASSATTQQTPTRPPPRRVVGITSTVSRQHVVYPSADVGAGHSSDNRGWFARQDQERATCENTGSNVETITPKTAIKNKRRAKSRKILSCQKAAQSSVSQETPSKPIRRARSSPKAPSVIVLDDSDTGDIDERSTRVASALLANWVDPQSVNALLPDDIPLNEPVNESPLIVHDTATGQAAELANEQSIKHLNVSRPPTPPVTVDDDGFLLQPIAKIRRPVTELPQILGQRDIDNVIEQFHYSDDEPIVPVLIPIYKEPETPSFLPDTVSESSQESGYDGERVLQQFATRAALEIAKKSTLNKLAPSARHDARPQKRIKLAISKPASKIPEEATNSETIKLSLQPRKSRKRTLLSVSQQKSMAQTRKPSPVAATVHSSLPATPVDINANELDAMFDDCPKQVSKSTEEVQRLATQICPRAPDFMSANSFHVGSILKLDQPIPAVGISARQMEALDFPSQLTE